MTAEEPTRYLEEEVESKQSAAGDDGKPGGVSTGDGLGHVGRVLTEKQKKDERKQELHILSIYILPIYSPEKETGTEKRRQERKGRGRYFLLSMDSQRSSEGSTKDPARDLVEIWW